VLPAPTPGLRSAYAFAYWKSGSTLLDRMLLAYCELTRVAYFSLFGQAFRQGVNTMDVAGDAGVCFTQEGYVFSGFRHYPAFDLPLGDAQPIILLVRDPRDMLVSLYFSVTKSHVIPDGNENLMKARQHSAAMSIDAFVLERVPTYINAYRRYTQKLAEKPVTLFRYEDVVFHKEEWLKQLVEVLELPYRQRSISRVARQLDIVPATEDDAQHIRKVHPGDHKVKLQPATIEKLTADLAPFLSAYGYC
jgi:hypothetical protein